MAFKLYNSLKSNNTFSPLLAVSTCEAGFVEGFSAGFVSFFVS